MVLVAAGEGISCMPGTYFAGLDSVVAVPFSDLGMGMRYAIAESGVFLSMLLPNSSSLPDTVSGR